MGQILSGVPKVVASVVDKSLVFNRDTTSIICLMGPTARGVVGKPVYIRNRNEFIRELGGRIVGSEFVLYCLRILDAGGKLWVSRVGHYTDATDRTTLEGTKAKAKITDGAAVETRAVAIPVITDIGDDTNIFSVTHNGVSLGSYAVKSTDDLVSVVTGIADSISSGSTGYNVVAVDTGTGAITINPPLGTGDAFNGQDVVVSVTGTGSATGTTGTFTGGVNPVEQAISFVAEEIGEGYNGTLIQINNPESGDTTKVDILVTAAGSDITLTVSDFPKQPTAQNIVDANKKLKFVKIESVANNVITGSSSLLGGVEDISLIDDNDYIGNQTARTGWWSFGKVTNAFRIANIDRPSPAVDASLAAYVESRGDMRFHIAPPINVTPDGAKDYRLGENTYNHNAINDWKGSIWAGQVDINDPDDAERSLEIPAIVDFLGRRATVDSDGRFGPWWTAAGPQRGVITAPNNGVGEYNFISPENSDASDEAFNNGINAIVDDETYGTVVWGNKSLLTNRSSLLNKENVADLAMFIQRAIQPLVRVELFNPNDPQTWKAIYRQVKPFIETVLVSGRAILPGEGINWFWIGDQEVDRFEDATFNTLNELNNGKYRVRFVCVPISATEFIGIDIVVTDSNSVASVVETPNV